VPPTPHLSSTRHGQYRPVSRGIAPRAGGRRRRPEDRGTVTKVLRREVVQRAVRSKLVVVVAPFFDHLARFVQAANQCSLRHSSRIFR
jgi:hypothetical protein